MGGGTGTGAAPVVAQAARSKGILTVGVVTKPFHFEGGRRMRLAEQGIQELQKTVDTLIVIPNQNLFRIANDKTTFADAFAMADQVLYSGVACITDLMVKEGLINLDFADVRSVMREMGRAMMGTGEASGQGRAMQAAEAAIANPLLDETSMKGAQGLLISITGGRDLTLFEVDEAATRIREEVDPDANIILGATFDEALEGVIRVSVVATGIDRAMAENDLRAAEMRAAQKPIIRPSAAVASAPAAAQPAMTQAPRTAPVDPIAETIRQAEAAMERELSIPAPQAAAPVIQPAVAQPVPAPQPMMARPAAPAEEEFRPQSRLFQATTPAPVEPVITRAPIAPVAAPAPAPSMAPSAPSFMTQAPQPVAAAAPQPAPRVAPAPIEPSAPVIRHQAEQVRMPRVEDFPPVVKAEMESRTQPAQAAAEERGPMGLLKRITNSLGRRDEEESVASDMTAAPAAASQQRRALSPEASLYAPRRGNLDDHGRSVPQASHHDDDQLEIPAFLRRQST
jgi:cell division protein FtsZ